MASTRAGYNSETMSGLVERREDVGKFAILFVPSGNCSHPPCIPIYEVSLQSKGKDII